MSRRRTTMTIVDGAEVLGRDIRTDHDVDHGVATGAVTLAAPRPHQVEIGAPVDIYAGYDGATSPIFSGRVAEFSLGYDRSGSETRVELEGHGKTLYYRYQENHGFYGPMSINVWWRSLCNALGVPRYRADATTDIHGTEILLGDNADYRGGWIPIEPDSPGDQIDRLVQHFGYRSFDTPLGQRLQRISGLPTEDAADLLQYIQGQNILGVERTVTPAGMVNAVELWGAEYQAPDTSEVAIRSVTGTYTPDPLFGPTGLNTLKVGPDAMIGSVALADAARETYEVDRGAEQWRYRWTVPGDPDRIPGEQVALWSRIVNGSTSTDFIDQLIAHLPRAVWLMRVSHVLPQRGGWITTMEGWAGTGTAMPAADDTDEIPLLGEQGVHIGNEWLWHYRNESPSGNVSQYEHHISFPVPETYTTLTIRGIHHGSNSFVRNQESTASRFEIWQFGERKASGEMPRSNEYLEQRKRYDLTNDVWDSLVVPLTGSLDPDPTGDNTYLAIISGEDRDVGDYDDLEAANLVLHAGGVGTPTPIS